MTTGWITGALVVALAVAAAGALFGAAALEPVAAGTEARMAITGAEAEPAWPVCRPASPAGGGKGAGMEQVGILARAGLVPPIDTGRPARTELATFALG